MAGNSLPEAVVETLQMVVPRGGHLHEPEFSGNEWSYVRECLDSGWVSSVGSFVDRFERDLADLTRAEHVVATVNGTAALHVSLMLAGVKAGDEVLMPTLTFVGTANAVSYCQATPHFIDCEEATFGVDPRKLASYLEEIAEVRDGSCHNSRTGARIAALICVHVLGHPADLDPLAAVCERFSLPLIEDAAESLGSTYKDCHTGNHGRISALSFNGNKIVTTGGGGAVLTNDANIAKRAKHLTTTAKQPHPWLYDHDHIGYNYRLPNLNAALGCAQLEQLPRFVEEKRALAAAYQDAFAELNGVTVFAEQPFARSNYWLNALILDDGEARDDVLRATNDRQLMTRPLWTPMHRLPMFADSPRMNLETTESLVARTINIPSSPKLSRTLA